VQPKLFQFGADVQRWIDGNAPQAKAWTQALGSFGDGVLVAWNGSLPRLENRLASFATSIEDSMARIRRAWAKTFGGGEGEGEGDLMKMLGWYLTSMVTGTGELVLYAIEVFTEQIAGMFESMLYTVGAAKKAMEGDWEGAMELLRLAALAKQDADALQILWDDIVNLWEQTQQQPQDGGRQGGFSDMSLAPIVAGMADGGGGYNYEGDTINVFINGQAAGGDIRAQARLGVAEALRARGAQ
jgi:hypothetical protein